MLNYSLIKFDFGIVGVVYSKNGIRKITLPEKSEEKVLQKIKKEKVYRKDNAKILKVLKNQLQRYFRGENVKFSIPLDLEGKSEFQKKVYKNVLKIPYGKISTYKEIAKNLNTSPRAVGQALKKNTLPLLIPCHRVIGEDCSYRGFSEGISWKRKLLKIENVKIKYGI